MISAQLRETILAEQEKIASKSRFGLFTQPPPLAVGDDSAYKAKQHPRGEDGKPITKPRNLLAGTNRSGQGKKGYFNVPQSIYKGDEYQDPFKLQVKYQKTMHTRSSFHQTQFKPASGVKTLVKSAYEYKQQNPLTQKKRKMDQNGRVFTQPKNVTTNTMSKVERQFMKNPQHIADPYDRKRQQQRKQKQIWRSKMPQSDWKFAHSSIGTFNKVKQVFGQDEQAKQLMASKKQPRKLVMKTVAHQSGFVPAVKNVRDPIGKYPKAMSAQSMQTLRPQTTQKKDQQRWRPNGYPKSKPTPSISLNRKNIHIGRYK